MDKFLRLPDNRLTQDIMSTISLYLESENVSISPEWSIRYLPSPTSVLTININGTIVMAIPSESFYHEDGKIDDGAVLRFSIGALKAGQLPIRPTIWAKDKPILPTDEGYAEWMPDTEDTNE